MRFAGLICSVSIVVVAVLMLPDGRRRAGKTILQGITSLLTEAKEKKMPMMRNDTNFTVIEAIIFVQMKYIFCAFIAVFVQSLYM